MKKVVDLHFDTGSHVPKYRRIIDSIHQLVRDGVLIKGDRLPSLNDLCKKFNLSQDTVLMAYNELKTRGIITSSVGKGYYISNVTIDSNHKVFLLFDKLTTYKETLYESFKETLKGKGNEQIFFHYNNPKVFQNLIESAVGEYSEYVVMPLLDKSALSALDLLPKNKVFLLDMGRNLFRHKYPHVCQDFERDIYQILKNVYADIEKYKRIVLVIRHLKRHYKEIMVGVRDFCKQQPIGFDLVTDTSAFEVNQGDLFVVVDDRDLVFLVKQAQQKNLVLGIDVGILSYNETPLKEIIAGGITTVSTDFGQMGQSMANMVLSGKKEGIDNPFILTRRNSF